VNESERGQSADMSDDGLRWRQCLLGFQWMKLSESRAARESETRVFFET
jgi:hypothetical protein